MRTPLLLSALGGGAVALLAVVSTHNGSKAEATPPDDRASGQQHLESAGVRAIPPQEIVRTPSWVTERTVDGPPVSLTASDGSGLALAEMRSSAVVEGPLAYTEMHLAFDNPENRIREGTFKVVLPQGASIGRFAMKIDGVWQEGEVVPKQQARVAYEDALHRRQDPALLERGSGNEFTARVFPIPPKGRKELVLSYAQELTSGAPYALPLRGLPVVGMLDVSVAGEGVKPQHMHQERTAPSADFVMEEPERAPPVALRSGNLVVARVRPVAEALPDPVERAVVLVDTSASRALGLAAELRSVQAVLQGLADRHGDSLPVSVAAFDQDVAPIYKGEAKGFGASEAQRILDRRALGASNLERALGWARDEAQRTGATRVIMVTDAVPTAGQDDAAKLGKAAAAMREGGAQRLDIVAVGGLRDDGVAHKLVTAGLPRDGVVVEGTEAVATLVRRLEAGTRSDVAVAVEGASWSYPTHLDGVQPGDEVLVYAEVPEGAPLRVHVGGGDALAFDAAPADRPLVERAWAQAKIASLEAEERDHGRTADLQRQIVSLSTSHRVLSSYTALLVLETDADYARFNIDRRALADILTVSDGRLASLKRPWEENKEKEANNIQPKVVAVPKSDKGHHESFTVSTGDSVDEPTARAPAPAATATAAPADDRKDNDSYGGLAGISAGGSAAQGSVSGAAVSQQAQSMRMDSLEALGGTGTRARGEEGSMGNPVTAAPSAAPPARHFTPPPPSPPPPVALAPMPAPPSETPPGFRDLSADDVPHATSAPRPAPRRAGPTPLGGGAAAVAPASPVSGAFASALGDGSGADGVDPFTGKFKQVKERIARGDPKGALGVASSWQASEPGDVLALVALGETSEATGDALTAGRAYGSIIDLFPSRADLRRFAGERLEHIKGNLALDLAIDTFDKARRDRPDHPASHRLAAFARVRRGELAAAFDILVAGLAQHYPDFRFLGVEQILREDLGLVAAAWMKAEPSRAKDILARLHAAGGSVEDGPSLRFVLNWETDANDVDFHIHDALGGHAYYGSKHLESGGDLYADVTTGYGPECFTVRKAKAQRAGPYSLQAHYFSRGSVGYGMGKLEIIEHDGHGGLKFQERPFVVMADHAFVNLGTID